MPFKRLVFAASLTAGIRSLLAVTALLMLSSFSAMPARAHSPQQLETQLQRQEKFFQPVGRLAPEFDLQDSEGHPWDLDRLRGKVVVLNFIYAGCKDLCPLHSELIAELQKMINLTPMRVASIPAIGPSSRRAPASRRTQPAGSPSALDTNSRARMTANTPTAL